MNCFQLNSLSGPRLARRLMERFALEDADLPYHMRSAGTPVARDKQFSSYDYLDLRKHPEVLAAASDALYEHGMSATASRLVAGQLNCHLTLEEKIANLYHQQSALLFVGGHSTNVSTVSALVEAGDLILMDQYSHNSIQVGAKLSGAHVLRFNHNDTGHLSSLLSRYRASYQRCLIITEGHFSMDGDCPPLEEICTLRDHYHAVLMVDEAHSLGVLGCGGLGTHQAQRIDPARVDVWMGTLSKSLGSTGGFIAACREVIDHLSLYASGFTFSVGLNAPSCAAAEAALDLLVKESHRVDKLRTNSIYLWNMLKANGFDVGLSSANAIIPVMLSPREAISVSRQMLLGGWSVYPLTPPSVPITACRLRLFVRADHEIRDLDALVTALIAAAKHSDYSSHAPYSG